MQIKFNPRITGAFTELIMKDNRVKEILSDVDESKRHNITKTILIAGFGKYKIDINEMINHINSSEEEQ